VLKPFSANEIRNSIDTLLQGAASNAGEPNSNLPITPREAQVLLLLGQGLHQHEIGKRLGLSLRTVKMYRSFLKDKLGLNSLVEVARFCDRHRPAIAMKAGVAN
jgi:DNA-binding NarL/FixJ family response regulator